MPEECNETGADFRLYGAVSLLCGGPGDFIKVIIEPPIFRREFSRAHRVWRCSLSNRVPRQTKADAWAERFEAAIACMEKGDTAGLRALLAETPDLVCAVDERNSTLLIRLIDWPGTMPSSAESCRVLVEAGADLEARRDSENGTALSGALCTESIDVIRVLLDAGADIHAPCGWQEGTVLDQANQLCENGLRSGEDSVRAVSELFGAAAGRNVPKRARLGGPIPLIFVRDFEAALRFYKEKLGFRLAWRVDQDPEDPYGSIIRGGTDFHITVCHCEGNVHVGRLDVRVQSGDIDELYREYCEAGVTIRQELGDRPWGLREFDIEDPDGNRFTFYDF